MKIIKKVDVAVIIVNYNSSDYSINCIDSINREVNRENISYQVILIDNNSECYDYNKLKIFCDENQSVVLIKNNINLGLSSAFMIGVQYANADYIYFLNNDTVLLNDNLKILIDFMKANSDAGIVTGQMYNSDKTQHHSFSYFPTLRLHIFGTSILRIFKPEKYLKKNRIYDKPIKVDLVTGAAMLIDAKKFMEVGGFDTNYFLYCEEEDMAMKLRKQNYFAYVVPDAKFMHHSGKSTGRNFEIEKENYISLLYYHRKYTNNITYNSLKFFYFIKNLRKSFRHKNYFKLAFFILFKARLSDSLRYKQKYSSDGGV